MESRAIDEPGRSHNFAATRARIGYTPRKETGAGVYHEMGFMSGLEIHQQLKTGKKLFCHCPAGIYQRNGNYDAEVIRHMRPTLSELGEYDGTALMEFRTRKTVVYRIADRTACTYDVDDTPPFKLNPEALEIALEIALLLKTHVVGELHIARKQYLDGSIPTGFQRTAIVGIEGAIPLTGKTVRIIQLSVEEDSCREVSDVGHLRVYTTDRLGMPLVETVTYPDMKTPDEVAEAANYIRFLTRSTGQVNTGAGAARQDVNVSIRGGTRVEIKGVSRIPLIPELVHNEAFRQKSLLAIRADLSERFPKAGDWRPAHVPVEDGPVGSAATGHGDSGRRVVAVNLPGFGGLLSFFTQPGRMFADELSDRLKVIACIEKPNMLHSEDWRPEARAVDWSGLRERLGAGEGDAQVLFWGPAEDIPTALETIEERCRLAFSGVPNETRKSFPDGTTMFERVLPGPDRMYPDTDSAPIPIDQEMIDRITARLPVDVDRRLDQFDGWGVPIDARPFILTHNLAPLVERIAADFGAEPRFVATLLAHRLKSLMGRRPPPAPFDFERIHALFAFVRQQGLEREILLEMLPLAYRHPGRDLDSLLADLRFSRRGRDAIVSAIPGLREHFSRIRTTADEGADLRWVMGELRAKAVGNMPLADLARIVRGGGGHE